MTDKLAKWASHSDMVKALAKDGKEIKNDITPLGAHLWHMSSCIQGEAGELFDAVKKVSIYGKNIIELDLDNVIEELGDIEFYMEGLRQSLGIKRKETIDANMNKLGKRYNTGQYSNKQAQDRADKDE